MRANHTPIFTDLSVIATIFLVANFAIFYVMVESLSHLFFSASSNHHPLPNPTDWFPVQNQGFNPLDPRPEIRRLAQVSV
jgi:hypothetical protein